MKVIDPETGRTVPRAWISVTSGPVRLAHEQSARIPLELTVPRTAAPGRYFSDVIASGSPASSAGGAGFGVAAATDLEFTVASGAVSTAWFSAPGWLLPYVLAVVIAGVLVAIIRPTGLRIRIERGPVRGRGR